MNNITITGTLGRDIEVRATPKGEVVGNFSIADNQGRDKPAIWWNCQLWGKRNESLQPYLTKGAKVCVTGTVTEREWTDKDGQKRKSLDVRVNDIDPFCGGKSRDEGQATQQRPAASPPTTSGAKSSGGFDDMEDDIPF